MLIDQNTKLFCVIGNPIGHSLSPVMHNTAFNIMSLNAVYLAFETGDIESSIRGIRAFGVKGASVTVPYKTSVMKMLDEVDETAKKIGAVNTIVNRSGTLFGYNTDAIGAFRALEENTSIHGKSCIIVGAGGAAKAIGYMLKENGIDLTVANRSQKRGEELANLLSCSFIPLDKIEGFETDILINTTPVGMSPEIGKCPVPENILKNGMVVMDVIYNPLRTKLLEVAESRGCYTINGLSMFIKQGAEQFRLWTGLEPPLKEMEAAVTKALRV